MSARHGKKYREAAAAIEEGKFYPPAEAMSLVRQTATRLPASSIPRPPNPSRRSSSSRLQSHRLRWISPA